jgi:hypothetical protein
MKTKLIIVSVAVLCLSLTPARSATFNVGTGTYLQDVLNDITKNGAGVDLADPASPDGDWATQGNVNSSVNVLTNDLPDGIGGDAIWSVGGSGGAINTVVVELAGWAGTNTLGVYDTSNSNTKVELFDGAATAGSQVTLGFLVTGEVVKGGNPTGIFFGSGNEFGFYLDASVGNQDWGFRTPAQIAAGDGIMYSQTGLNADGLNHMYAYQGVGDTVQIGNWAHGLWNPNEYILAFEDSYNYSADEDYTDFVVMVESVNPVPVPGALLLGILGLSAAGLKLRKHA